MIILYHLNRATDFSVINESLTADQCRVLLENASRLLNIRSQTQASEILRTIPFKVVRAISDFEDMFLVLFAIIPINKYEELRLDIQDPVKKQAFQQIAQVLSELGTHIRYIAIELALESPMDPAIQTGLGLTQIEIKQLVYRYIGVSGGYLADFNYSSHLDFYIDLGLDIDPNKIEGTTRGRFIKILSESPPQIQARILEGILSRFPVGSSEIRTSERAAEIGTWIERLRTNPQVEQPTLRITSEVVDRALQDAQVLLRTTGATSGVDRIHTAIHGYLQEVCESVNLTIAEDAPLTELFRQLREQHPAFRDLGPRSDDILRVLRAFATILDSFNPLRNKASIAHPNSSLLPEPEAMLIINVARTILHYVDEKVFRQGTSKKQDD